MTRTSKQHRGMTSNPTIFEKAIADSHDYDADIQAMALEGQGAGAIYETISQRDVRSAADTFRPLYGARTARTAMSAWRSILTWRTTPTGRWGKRSCFPQVRCFLC
jgi:transaldolase